MSQNGQTHFKGLAALNIQNFWTIVIQEHV